MKQSSGSSSDAADGGPLLHCRSPGSTKMTAVGGGGDSDRESTFDERSTSPLPPSSASLDDSPCGIECCYFPRRYIVVLLLFFGLCVVHAQRVNVGVAVVSILDARHGQTLALHGSGAAAGRSAAATDGVETPHSALSDIQWDNRMIGWLHAVFYVGLLISQIPCGWLVTIFPSHRLFGGCILLTHSLNFLLPLSISENIYVLTCVIRLMQGLIEGLLYPSCYDVMRHWTMPEERSRTGATVLTGAYIGPTLGMIASGLLNHYAGWKYVFYFHGALGVALYFIWLVLVYERPSTHPDISIDECKTIEARQGEAALIYEHDSVPWKAIFTSLPVYALIVCNFARSFVFYMLLTSQPTFLNVFKFTLAENGLYSSLPYLFMAVFAFSSGPIADLLISRAVATPTIVRKMFTCFGFGLSAIFFFALAIVNYGEQAVVCLTLAVGLSGIAISGWQINHLDLAPRYAGVLVAITMVFGMLAGVVNPLIVAALTQHQTLEEWHHVFWLTGALLTFSLTFYAFFGSGERQSWAVPGPPPVRIITPSDPLHGKPPYGTFSPQVKYTSATSELTISRPETPPPNSSAEASQQQANRLEANLSMLLSTACDDRTAPYEEGITQRRKSASVEHFEPLADITD